MSSVTNTNTNTIPQFHITILNDRLKFVVHLKTVYIDATVKSRMDKTVKDNQKRQIYKPRAQI